MIQSKVLALSALAFFGAVSASCLAAEPAEPPPPPPAAVAAKPAPRGIGVVDLDRIAKAMGWDEDMKQNLAQTQKSVARQLNEILKPGVDTLQKTRDKIAKEANLSDAQVGQLNDAKSKAELVKLGLSPAQMEELSSAFAFAYDENKAAQSRLDAVVKAQRDEIVKVYREATRPAVRRVAHANDIGVVMLPGGDMFYYDSAVDITDKVIDELQHSTGIKIQLPEVPKLHIDPNAR